MGSTPKQLQAKHAARITSALAQAVIAMNDAEQHWADWADDVRQAAEIRHHRPFAADDPVILNDTDYGAALDLGAAVRQALDDLRELACRFEHLKADVGAVRDRC